MHQILVFHQLKHFCCLVTNKNKLGVSHEATIDSDKIRRAKKYMTQTMDCKVYGIPHHFYRFCKDITFDNELTFTNLIALVTTLKKISSATEAKILSITPNRRDLFFIQNTFCDKKFIRATIWLYETRTIGSLQ